MGKMAVLVLVTVFQSLVYAVIITNNSNFYISLFLLMYSQYNHTVPFTVSQKYTMYTVLMEKAMAPHSSTPAWKIPWTKEPGRLQSMGLRRVAHD